MNVFLDSSALVKLYIEEDHSDRVQSLLMSATALSLCVLATTELISAFARRKRERLLSEASYRQLKQSLLGDLVDATIVSINDIVVGKAVVLLERSPLRSADSLHVAAALTVGADLFVSADHQQCVAARAAGLQVEELGDEGKGPPDGEGAEITDAALRGKNQS